MDFEIARHVYDPKGALFGSTDRANLEKIPCSTDRATARYVQRLKGLIEGSMVSEPRRRAATMAKPFVDVHLSAWCLTGLDQLAGRE